MNNQTKATNSAIYVVFQVVAGEDAIQWTTPFATLEQAQHAVEELVEELVEEIAADGYRPDFNGLDWENQDADRTSAQFENFDYEFYVTRIQLG